MIKNTVLSSFYAHLFQQLQLSDSEARFFTCIFSVVFLVQVGNGCALMEWNNAIWNNVEQNEANSQMYRVRGAIGRAR